nr:MAG TPA: hypothetical protein [Caudoviricetes sp.]
MVGLQSICDLKRRPCSWGRLCMSARIKRFVLNSQ